jgi:hypothetical protein
MILGWLLAPIKTSCPADELNVFGPFETFTFRFKVALFGAIVAFSPVIIWQIMGFFLPALKPNERKWVVPTFLAAVVLFLGGAAFAYFVIMRPAFEFMFAQGGEFVTDTERGSVPQRHHLAARRIRAGLRDPDRRLLRHRLRSDLVQEASGELAFRLRRARAGRRRRNPRLVAGDDGGARRCTGGAVRVQPAACAKFAFAKRIKEQEALALETES